MRTKDVKIEFKALGRLSKLKKAFQGFVLLWSVLAVLLIQFSAPVHALESRSFSMISNAWTQQDSSSTSEPPSEAPTDVQESVECDCSGFELWIPTKNGLGLDRSFRSFSLTHLQLPESPFQPSLHVPPEA